MIRKLEYLISALFIAMLLAGCFGRPAPINVKSIRTVINEDSSGVNTFRFAKPVNCEMLDFRPALDEFKSQYGGSGEDVIVSEFNDGTDSGWDVSVKFDSPEQIPAQIEGLKRSIVLTVKNSWTGSSAPDWDSLAATNENEFSVKVDRPAPAEQGMQWSAAITINPVMLAAPETQCSYPQVDYEIVMPGKIKAHEVTVKAFSAIFEGVVHGTAGNEINNQLLNYAVAKKTGENALLWEIEPKSIGEIMLENDGIDLDQLIETSDSETLEVDVGQMIYAHLLANDEERIAMEQLLGVPIQNAETAIFLIALKPIYTINVDSATPMSFTQYLTNNITPIVILVGGIVGAIFTIMNIRQAILKRKEKA
ncbi:MAG: hypothetical protein IT314_05035 [Anaerolineales bacterium]|nr:hypothetical protein [Anaerolineales bacterium]